MALQLPMSVCEQAVWENKKRGRVEIGRRCERESNSSVVLLWRDWGKARINETLLLGGASWVDLNLKSFLLFVPPLADLNEKTEDSKDMAENEKWSLQRTRKTSMKKVWKVSGGIWSQMFPLHLSRPLQCLIYKTLTSKVSLSVCVCVCVCARQTPQIHAGGKAARKQASIMLIESACWCVYVFFVRESVSA